MRAVVQRCKKAYVEIDEKRISEIGKGLMVLLGVEEGDTQEDVDYIVNKIAHLRIFEDENGVMNLSAKECHHEILMVSQFTLLGDARKGRRPSYIQAAQAEEGEKYYLQCTQALSDMGFDVKKGVFMADMQVGLINDGPVTILLDSRRQF